MKNILIISLLLFATVAFGQNNQNNYPGSGSAASVSISGVSGGVQGQPVIGVSGSALASSPVFIDTTQTSGADRGAAVHSIWTTGLAGQLVKSLTMDMRGEIVNDATLGHGQITFTTSPFPLIATYGGTDPNVGPTFILPPAGLQMGAPAILLGDQTLIQGEGPGGTLGSGIQGTMFSPASGVIPIETTTSTAFNPCVFCFGVNAGNIQQGIGPYSNKVGGFAVDADFYAPAATVQPNVIPFTYYSGQDLNIIDWIAVRNGMGVNLDMGGGSSSVAGNGTVSHVFSTHSDTNSCISQTATIASWAVVACGAGGANACAVVTYSGTPSTGTVTTANSGGNTTLTIATGPNFPYQTSVTSGTIQVNGVNQTIVSAQSATQITISGNLGSSTVPYNIGPAELPQIGGAVLVTGAAVGGTHGESINRTDWAKICAIPGPSNTAESNDRRCTGITFSSASQFAYLVNLGQTDSSGTAQGTANYRPVGVRWDGAVLSGGKSLGPMSISAQSCVGGVGTTTGVTQAQAVDFDASGDLEEAKDIHGETAAVGIQVGSGGITKDWTFINPNPSSETTVGMYLSNYWGAPTDINIFGLGGAGTDQTGATTATTVLKDVQNGNILTSTHNKYVGLYVLDHGGYDFSLSDPQGGTEIANGINEFNGDFAGFASGAKTFDINAPAGSIVAKSIDLSGSAVSNALKVPGQAGLVSDGANSIGYDTTAKNFHIPTNGADGLALVTGAVPVSNRLLKASGGGTINSAGASLATDNGTTLTYTGTGGINVAGVVFSGGGNISGPVTNSTPVTVSNPTGATDTIMMALSLPANYLNTVGQPFHITGAGVLSTTNASIPQVTITPKVCSVAGCGSGTVTPLAAIQSSALNTTAVSNATWKIDLDLIVAANGASCNFIVKGMLAIDLGAAVAATPDTIFVDSNTAVSSPNQTCTNALFLDFFVQQSTTGASNSYKQLLGMIR